MTHRYHGFVLGGSPYLGCCPLSAGRGVIQFQPSRGRAGQEGWDGQGYGVFYDWPSWRAW